nr:tigger transposable element-derived protein 1-like isoform X1 [Anolis sagrei ordinatus]XP_060616131.1 tigger transposable element-derived protein 1-like isoform X1 [Anolis sagrei ordinatus]XP_060616133.1 tigger transposable element-derived protein 1-like isoform X1 [Anolis sagrei ordinatus]XP_060616134.1 tigger transposable element-derived protein 1-like isoform X1 [Anolis sagrei ordinatus]
MDPEIKMEDSVGPESEEVKGGAALPKRESDGGESEQTVKQETEDEPSRTWDAQLEEFLRTLQSSSGDETPQQPNPQEPQMMTTDDESHLDATNSRKERTASKDADLLLGVLETQRQHFRMLIYQEAEGPRNFWGKLRKLCQKWLLPERHTKEQILDLVTLEQFLAALPPDMQKWLRGRYPQTCSQAVALAEDFLLMHRGSKGREGQITEEFASSPKTKEVQPKMMLRTESEHKHSLNEHVLGDDAGLTEREEQKTPFESTEEMEQLRTSMKSGQEDSFLCQGEPDKNQARTDKDNGNGQEKVWLTVGPKKVSAKKKRMMCLDIKHEIIEKHERGVRVVDLARQYDRSTSTICSILKQKESIKAITPAKGIKIISKLRTSAHEEMEKLLLLWLTEKQLAGDTMTESIVCKKARAIYGDLVRQAPERLMDEASEESFKASRGWFDNFKKRTGIHSVVRHGEAADVKAAEDFRIIFAKLIEAEGYIPQQVFNCDETGLVWKRMPRRTFITTEEKSLPGHKPTKDRLTLALCANASGDCKIKPLLVYHSENSSDFKSHQIIKEKLQVMWRANPKAWVTREIFVQWVNLVFGPGVKKYLLENGLPLKALLVLDSAPAHPPNLEDYILEEFNFVKVLYLPANTTLILQPMSQQVISDFKKLFTKHLFRHCFEVTKNTDLTLREFWEEHYNIVTCLGIIDTAWQGVTRRSLNSAWKKLWPEVVSERRFEEFEPEELAVEEIVSIGKSMGLEVDEGDLNNLIKQHDEELTTEELQELLEQQQCTEILQEINVEEPEAEEVIDTSEIKEMLGMWEKVSDFIEKKHPEKVATSHALALCHDTCLTPFRNILKGRKQASLDRFTLKRPLSENEERVVKKANVKEEED